MPRPASEARRRERGAVRAWAVLALLGGATGLALLAAEVGARLLRPEARSVFQLSRLRESEKGKFTSGYRDGARTSSCSPGG